MAALDRIIDGVREVLRATDEIKRLSVAVKEISEEMRDLDRRLVRIETLAELSASKRSRSSPKRIEGSD